MVKILISNVSILTLSLRHEPLIERGYIFISNGRVTAIGKGEPPEELRYPELLINGRGRLLIPGTSAPITSATLYPFRYRLRGLRWDVIKDFLSVITRTDVYYLSCMMFMDMVLRGVTSSLVTDVYLDSVARAAHDVGVYATLAVPLGLGLEEFDPIHELKLLIGRWGSRVEGIRPAIMINGLRINDVINELEGLGEEVRGLTAYVINPTPKSMELRSRVGVNLVLVNPSFSVGEGVGIIRMDEGLRNWRPGEGLGLGIKPSYNMFNVIRQASTATGTHALDALHDAVVVNPRLIGHEVLGGINVGGVANVVMLNTSEPPGWPPPVSINDVVNAVVNGDLRIETVILSDNVLVDAGETLTMGSEIIRKARDRFDKELSKYLKKVSLKSSG